MGDRRRAPVLQAHQNRIQKRGDCIAIAKYGHLERAAEGVDHPGIKRGADIPDNAAGADPPAQSPVVAEVGPGLSAIGAEVFEGKGQCEQSAHEAGDADHSDGSGGGEMAGFGEG